MFVSLYSLSFTITFWLSLIKFVIQMVKYCKLFYITAFPLKNKGVFVLANCLAKFCLFLLGPILVNLYVYIYFFPNYKAFSKYPTGTRGYQTVAGLLCYKRTGPKCEFAEFLE